MSHWLQNREELHHFWFVSSSWFSSEVARSGWDEELFSFAVYLQVLKYWTTCRWNSVPQHKRQTADLLFKCLRFKHLWQSEEDCLDTAILTITVHPILYWAFLISIELIFCCLWRIFLFHIIHLYLCTSPRSKVYLWNCGSLAERQYLTVMGRSH